MSNVNVKPNPLPDRTWIDAPNPRSKAACEPPRASVERMSNAAAARRNPTPSRSPTGFPPLPANRLPAAGFLDSSQIIRVVAHCAGGRLPVGCAPCRSLPPAAGRSRPLRWSPCSWSSCSCRAQGAFSPPGSRCPPSAPRRLSRTRRPTPSTSSPMTSKFSSRARSRTSRPPTAPRSLSSTPRTASSYLCQRSRPPCRTRSSPSRTSASTSTRAWTRPASSAPWRPMPTEAPRAPRP